MRETTRETTIVVPKSHHYPSWTAKDFDVIARTIASLSDRPSKRQIIEAFRDVCVHTNPGFDEEIFIHQCGGER